MKFILLILSFLYITASAQINNWISQKINTNINMNVVIEGHSFMYSGSSMNYILRELLLYDTIYTYAQSGDHIQSCIDREDLVDAESITETKLNKNVLVLWIGVNDIINTAGQGTTAYNLLKTYVMDRSDSGWTVFCFTMTKATSGGRGATFESERNIFNNYLRTDLYKIPHVYIINTDNRTELNNAGNTDYFSDGLHPTFLGSYTAFTELRKKMLSVYGDSSVNNSTNVASLTVTSSGTGSGVGTLVLNTFDFSTLSVTTGNAKFYTNAEGTEGESSIVNLSATQINTVYIKCSSGTSTLTFSSNRIYAIGGLQTVGWSASTNAPILGGNITKTTFPNIVSLYLYGNNNVNFYTAGYNSGVNCLRLLNGGNVIGSITNLTGLTDLRSYGTSTNVYGNLTGLPLTYMLLPYNYNTTDTLTGDVSTLPISSNGWLMCSGTNKLYGSISGLTNAIHIVVSGKNTLSGDIASLTNLWRCYVAGAYNTVTYSNTTNIHGISDLAISSATTLTSENVNQILADFWANRNYTKNWAGRGLNLLGSASTGPPTGQGIIDKANLQAAGYTVTTR